MVQINQVAAENPSLPEKWLKTVCEGVCVCITRKNMLCIVSPLCNILSSKQVYVSDVVDMYII